MQVKITSVYDEGALERTSLIGAEGFAVMIELDGRSILFDTGKRGRYLLHNMMFLDMDPQNVGKVVISHGHSGHAGGIADILRNRNAPLGIYAPRSAIEKKGMFGTGSIRIPEELSENADVYEVTDWMEIEDKVFVSRPMDIGKGMAESFIVILSKKGPVVVAACSHAGVDMIMEEVKRRFGSFPCMYIGGIHMKKKIRQKAEELAVLFTEAGCKELYLNHCAETNGIMYLRAALGIKGVNNFYVGSSVNIEI
jgi:7,8-dihydropterin-6-yl-methyl-4-(beta-D-ribofuranosyl)aminobenzene 5'-phosphate synthase